MAWKDESGQEVTDPKLIAQLEAQQNPMSDTLNAVHEQIQKQRSSYTTPAQELTAENRPLQKGMEAAGESASQGVLGTIAAPSAGMAEAGGTAVHNVLSSIPGLGGPSGAVPAAGGALGYAAGSLAGGELTGGLVKKLFTTAPELLQGVKSLIQGTNKEQVIGDIVNKYAGRAAGYAERIKDVGQGAGLYEQAEKVQGAIPLRGVTDKIRDLVSKEAQASTPSKLLLGKLNKETGQWSGGLLTNAVDTYGSRQGSLRYLMSEEQRLGQQARDLLKSANPDSNAATKLNTARQIILDEMDKISPLVKQANQNYLTKVYGDELVDNLWTGGKAVAGKIRSQLETDPVMKKAFGIQSEQQIKEFTDLVQKAANAGDMQTKTQRLVNIAKYAGAGYMTHYFITRYLWRSTMGEGH